MIMQNFENLGKCYSIDYEVCELVYFGLNNLIQSTLLIFSLQIIFKKC